MSLLTYYMPAAEIFIGGTFADGFESAYAIGQNGGTPQNDPTYSDDGIVLDGVDQYVSYTLDNNVLNSDPLSFVIEFYPDFDYDEDAIYKICDSG